MPEGPEIRRAADAIAEVLEGQLVHKVRFGLPRLKGQASRLRGQRVHAVETRGKAMLTHFEHGWTIYSHNQLYGVWRVVEGHRLPSTNRSLRMLLQTDSHSAILYSASDISVWPTQELSQHPFLARLGPDVMNEAVHWREIAARLAEAPFRGRTLANLYLDQGFIAGIGNYLRTEILHDAGLNPSRRAASLTRGERGRLARATLEISRRSYDTGGVTLKPGLSRRLERLDIPRPRRRFAAFGRTGQPCYGCAEPILREEVNSRRLYWCPRCQPEP